MSASVVITGLGTVNPLGCGRGPTAEALRDSTPLWTEIDRSPGYHRLEVSRLGARLYGRATGHDLSPWVSGGAARRMSQPSKLAVAAARMALDEAGIELGQDLAGKPTAMVFSNAWGPSAFTEKILAQIEGHGPQAVSPALFMESVANAPAAQVALACRAVGANITVTQREAGPVMALGRAVNELRRGRAGCAVVVTVDEATSLLHAVLDRYGALARPGGPGQEEVARPFDRRRNGFIFSEGATALVLETADTASTRGAAVLAEVRGTVSAFDPRAPVYGWGPDAETLTPCVQRLLDRTGDVDAVVSGASGSVYGDRIEAQLLRGLWGASPLPPVLAPKAVLGEFGGAQLAAAVLALAGESFGPTAGFSEPDPELGVVPHDGSPFRASSVLLSSLATGGAAAWTVLGAASGG